LSLCVDLSVEGKSIPEVGNGFKFAFFTALITYSSQNLFYIARLVWFGGLVRMNGKAKILTNLSTH
jgi:hypothetical protein